MSSSKKIAEELDKKISVQKKKTNAANTAKATDQEIIRKATKQGAGSESIARYMDRVVENRREKQRTGAAQTKFDVQNTIAKNENALKDAEKYAGVVPKLYNRGYGQGRINRLNQITEELQQIRQGENASEWEEYIQQMLNRAHTGRNEIVLAREKAPTSLNPYTNRANKVRGKDSAGVQKIINQGWDPERTAQMIVSGQTGEDSDLQYYLEQLERLKQQEQEQEYLKRGKPTLSDAEDMGKRTQWNQVWKYEDGTPAPNIGGYRNYQGIAGEGVSAEDIQKQRELKRDAAWYAQKIAQMDRDAKNAQFQEPRVQDELLQGEDPFATIRTEANNAAYEAEMRANKGYSEIPAEQAEKYEQLKEGQKANSQTLADLQKRMEAGRKAYATDPANFRELTKEEADYQAWMYKYMLENAQTTQEVDAILNSIASQRVIAEKRQDWDAVERYEGLQEMANQAVETAWNRMKGEEYARIAQNEDYGEYGYKSTWNGSALDFGMDRTYEIVNQNQDLISALELSGDVSGGSGLTAEEQAARFMTQEERAMYNYLYASPDYGKQAAEEYLEYLRKDHLNAMLEQSKLKKAEALRASGALGNIASSVASVGANIVSGIGAIDIAAQNAKKWITGDKVPIDYNSPYQYASKYTQQTRENTAAELNAKGTIDIPILGETGLGQLYQIGMSMADSLAARAVTGGTKASTWILGGSAATAGMQDAKERGADDVTALILGGLNGAFEKLFEDLSLDKLIKMKDPGTIKAALGNIVKQMGIEASEEMFTTIANTIADELVMADKSEMAEMAKAMMEQGYTKAEAEAEAKRQWLQNFLWDGIGGAISGGLMAGGQQAAQSIQTGAENRKTGGKIISEKNAEALWSIAKGMNEGSEARAAAEKIGEAGKASASQVGEVYRKTISELGEKYSGALKTSVARDAANRLTELGETQNARAVADAIVKLYGGETLTRAERRTVAESLYGIQVTREMLGMEEGRGEAWANRSYAGNLQETEKTMGSVRALTKGKEKGEAAAKASTAAARAETAAQKLRYAEETEKSDGLTAIGDVRGKITDIDEKGNITITAEDGQEATAKLADADYPSREAAILAAGAQEFGTDGAAIYGLWQQSQQAGAYLDAAERAYQAGQAGRTKYDGGVLSPAQSKAIYDMGRARDAERTGAIKARLQNAPRGTGRLNIDRIREKVHRGGKEGLTARQRTDLQAIALLAKSLKGVDFVIYESETDANGRYVVTGEVAKELGLTSGASAPNGAFDRQGRIWLDINGGKMQSADGLQTSMLRTAGHELTHYIRAFGDQQLWNQLKEFVTVHMEEMGEGLTFDEMIDRNRDAGMEYDDAVEETVANACEMMIRDSQIVNMLAEEKPGLFKNIKAWVDRWTRKIREAFTGIQARSEEARAMEAWAQELQKIWDEALKSAVVSREAERKTSVEEIPLAAAQQTDTQTETETETETETKTETEPETDTERDILHSTKPLSARDDAEMDSKEAKPFMLQHPEMQMWMVSAAAQLDEELGDAQPAEKFFLSDGSGVTGQKRIASQPIAELLDGYGFTYERIGKTLETIQSMDEAAIMRQHKSVKIVENVLDEMLEHGYQSTRHGWVEPDPDYIRDKAAAQGTAKFSTREKRITRQDLKTLRAIGRKSVNEFTGEEIRATEAWAKKFYQEIGVKSPYFRAWFGDWRAEDTRPTRVISVPETSGEIYRGSVKNADTGWEIAISAFGIKNTISHAGKDKLSVKAMQAIKPILENAVLFDSEVHEFHGKGTEATDNIAMEQKLYTFVRQNGTMHVAKITVDEIYEPVGDTIKRFHNLRDIKISPEFRNSLGNDLTLRSTVWPESGDVLSISDLFDAVKRFDKEFHPKAVNSALLNPDGTPKIMHHGTPYGGYTVFKDWQYFTESREYADKYQNPSASSIRGRYDAATQPMTYDVYLKVLKPFDTRIPAVRKIWQNEFFGAYSRTPLSEKGLPDWTDGIDLVEFIEENELDYDAIILDEGATGGYGDDVVSRGISVVVRSSEQVKSATDNMGTFDPENRDIRYSQRRAGELSDREILANAFEGMARNEKELDYIRRYRKNIDELNRMQGELDEIQSRMRERMYAKGPRGAEYKAEMEKDRNRAAILGEQIDRMDKKLLNFEAAKPLKDVVARQRAKDRKQIKAEYNKKLEQYRADRDEARKKAGLRYTIRRGVRSLDTALRKSVDAKHVPDELRTPVARLCQMFLNQGAFAQKDIAEIAAAYAAMAEGKASSDSHAADLYDPDIEDRLRELEKRLGKYTLADMPTRDLQDVQDIIDHFQHLIEDNNTIFIEGRKANLEQTAKKVEEEMIAAGQRKNNALNNSALWRMMREGMMRPEDFFDHIGGTLGELGKAVLSGETDFGINAQKAKDFFEATQKKYKYAEWGKKKEDATRELLIVNQITGETDSVKLTIGQAMSIYALNKREKTNTAQQGSHIQTGGIQLKVQADKQGKILKYTQEAGKSIALTEEAIRDIEGWLTDEQKAYADEMVGYLSSDMAELGNEVSKRMHGYSKFTEKYYFPYAVSGDFNRSKLVANQEISLLKNFGFTKRLTFMAKKPLAVDDFTAVCAAHVNKMLTYHAFAEAQDAFMRVYEYMQYNEVKDKEGKTTDVSGAASVKGRIRAAYGQAAETYIRQFMRDLYGGAGKDPSRGILDQWTGLFKAGAVAMNLSVAIQQPSAIARAFAEVNPKYFLGRAVEKGGWEQLKKYAGTAVIKDMGRYDTGMGRTVAEWIAGGAAQQSAFQKAGRAISDVGGWAPGKMDQITWMRIWNAVKRETAAKTGLTGEAMLQEAGKRFDQVTRRTQVYDSVLAKSQMMRSTDAGVKAATSFMAEPTVTYNMLMNAVMNRKKNPKGTMGKVIGAVAVASVFNVLLKSIVAALRDRDEDKSYVEKYLSGVVSGIVGSREVFYLDNVLSPATMLPLVKDAISIFQGYDVTMPWMSVATEAYKAYAMLGSDKKTPYQKIQAVAGAIGNMCGVPIKNVWRDLESVILTFTQTKPLKETSAEGLKYALYTGLGYDDSDAANVQRMLAAYAKGDKEAMEKARERLEKAGLTDKEIKSKAKSRIREMYLGGIGSTMAAKMLAKFCDMDANDAYFQMEAWDFNEQKGEDSEETYSRFMDIYAALDKGGSLQTAEKELLSRGYSQDEIDSKVKEYIGKQYREGEYAAAETKGKLEKYCGMDAEEIYWQMDKWDYMKKNGSTEGYSKYDALYAAVDKGASLESAAQEFLDKGDTWSDIDGKVKEYIRDQYVEGEISFDAAADKLVQYYGSGDNGFNDNALYLWKKQADYRKETGESASSAYCYMYDYISEGNDKLLIAEINDLVAHGKKKSNMATSIVNRYESEYRNLKRSGKAAEAENLKKRVLQVCGYLGYNKSKAVAKWDED